MGLITQPFLLATNADGTPMAFAKAYFTETGTTTSVPVYEDAAFGNEHTDPVVADARGRFPAIYADPTLGLLRLRVISATGSLASPDIDIDPVADMSGLGGVTNAFLADMPAATLKGNLTAGVAAPTDNDVDAVTDFLRYASATEQGVVELATDAEAVAGTDTTRAVTPAGLQAFIDAQTATTTESVASSGYVTLSNGVSFQWGRTALVNIDDYTDVVFPLEFPTACFNVQVSPRITDAYTLRYDSWPMVQGTPSVTGFRVYCASSANAHGIYVDWFAIGH